MLLTIATTHAPATDLGYLLHKNPAKCQECELSFGRVHVFYPEASAERCTAGQETRRAKWRCSTRRVRRQRRDATAVRWGHTAVVLAAAGDSYQPSGGKTSMVFSARAPRPALSHTIRATRYLPGCS